MSYFSGIADENDHVLLGGYPAPFRRLLGLRVEEYDPYVPGQTGRIAVPRGAIYTCDLWSDVIDLQGAEVMSTFVDGFYTGRPAVTHHRFGQGASYYLGTRPDARFQVHGRAADAGV
jgi:beta-galactosidase